MSAFNLDPETMARLVRKMQREQTFANIRAACKARVDMARGHAADIAADEVAYVPSVDVSTFYRNEKPAHKQILRTNSNRRCLHGAAFHCCVEEMDSATLALVWVPLTSAFPKL